MAPAPFKKRGQVPRSIVPSAFWEGKRRPDLRLRTETKLTCEIRDELVACSYQTASGLQSETGKDWRRSLYTPALPNYQPEALTQTLSLWESLSHLTTLWKASIPPSMVPWPGAAKMLENAGQQSEGLFLPAAAEVLLFVMQLCRVRDQLSINQEGFTPVMHTRTLRHSVRA